uniref:Uncharacterized protein n=1 Tax=Caenorhabditis japonica TaxID=281687 RepID=A0A8R1ECB5_CAEJA
MSTNDKKEFGTFHDDQGKLGKFITPLHQEDVPTENGGFDDVPRTNPREAIGNNPITLEEWYHHLCATMEHDFNRAHEVYRTWPVAKARCFTSVHPKLENITQLRGQLIRYRHAIRTEVSAADERFNMFDVANPT